MRKLKHKTALTLSGVRQQFSGGEGVKPPPSEENISTRTKKMNYTDRPFFRSLIKNRLSVSIVALAMAFGTVAPAYATINNTVTVSGTAPSGTPGAIQSTADETVDVENAAPALTVAKTAAITTDGDSDLKGDVGDIITYTYTIENTGNTTLTTVGVTDTHDGSAALATPGFASWTTQAGSPAATAGDTTITMLPGAVAVFTTTYTVTITDVYGGGGTGVGPTVDNDIDNSAVANSVYDNGTTTTDVDSTASATFVPLDVTASLSVTKVANDDTEVTAGQTITYTYVVTNSGTVPITNVSLSDNVTAGSGGNPTPTFVSLTNTSGNSVDDGLDDIVETLAPGDFATYTGTYTVTQSDVDTLQ